MTRHYAMAFFASAIALIGSLVGYGIYVNSSSNAHVTKMTASQYFKVGGAPAQYREIGPAIYLPTANIYSPRMSDVHFEMDGTITRIYVQAGDKVRAGQVLGEIVNNEIPSQILQAEGKIRSAEAGVAKWRGTVNRYRKLVSVGGIAGQQLDDAVSSLEAAEGELAATQAYHDQLASRLASQRITAPYDGDILRVYHSPGAVVRNGDSLVVIGDLSALYIRSNVAGEALEQLQPLTASLKLAIKENQLVEKAYASSLSGGNIGGDSDVQIAEIKPALDIPAQYRSVVFKINNPAGRLEPGTYYRLKLYVANNRRVLSVPKDAVITDEDAPYVYVVTADNRLEKRQVKTGIRDDDNVEIQSGVRENETVVVSGQEGGLAAGMKVRVITESQ